MDRLLIDLEPGILVSTSLVLMCAGYLAWPSRWNILAHLQLAFWAVSILLPVAGLGVQESFDEAARLVLLKAQLLGAAVYALCVWLGSLSSVPHRLAAAVLARLPSDEDNGQDRLAGRAAVALLASIALLAIALVVMGFVPMFAADAFAAKFFRGAYGEAYRPVAPLYRAGTTGLSMLIAVSGALACRGKSATWRVLLLSSVGLMLVTLQRGPAVTGLLLVIGVLMISRRRTGLFVATAVGVYVAGTLFYATLAYAGIGTFQQGSSVATPPSLVATIATTAPDLSDTLNLIERWDSYGSPSTEGRTFYGGLVPGNYKWNPSVWSLTVGQANNDITDVSSGGLRIPAPLWGLFAFGAPGVVLVCALSGFATGVLNRGASLVVPQRNPVSTVVALLLFQTLLTVVAGFFVSSYIGVIQVGILVFLLSRKRSHSSAGSVAIDGRDVILQPSRGTESRHDVL